MARVHLVYPHDDRISCPDAIGRHLADELRSNYEVRLYDWDAAGTIKPTEGDVLLGHPHPSPWSIFRRSLRHRGWGRRLIMAPYNHGDLRQSAWLDPLIKRCDLFLAITGDHWFSSAHASPFARWVPKMVQMDLAIDRREFPPIKNEFNPPGQRRFLFIGHSHWTKNVGYITEIVASNPPIHISWMGTGAPILGVKSLGLHDFRDQSSLRLVGQHDFVLSVGRADANPASTLEAMAWGLIPVSTKESGHADMPGVVTVPLDDPVGAASILEDLQTWDTDRLLNLQRQNWSELESRFTWRRFGERVVDAIESRASPEILRPNASDLTKITMARASSPYGWWRPGQVRAELRRWVARTR